MDKNWEGLQHDTMWHWSHLMTHRLIPVNQPVPAGAKLPLSVWVTCSGLWLVSQQVIKYVQEWEAVGHGVHHRTRGGVKLQQHRGRTQAVCSSSPQYLQQLRQRCCRETTDEEVRRSRRKNHWLLAMKMWCQQQRLRNHHNVDKALLHSQIKMSLHFPWTPGNKSAVVVLWHYHLS